VPVSLSSPIDVAFGELSESVADDEADRVCLVDWGSRVPDPRSLLGRRHRLEFVLGVAVCAYTTAGHEPADAVGEWATGCDQATLTALGGRRDPFTRRIRPPSAGPSPVSWRRCTRRRSTPCCTATSPPPGLMVRPKELPELTRPDVGFTAVAHPPHRRRWCAPATLKTGSVGCQPLWRLTSGAEARRPHARHRTQQGQPGRMAAGVVPQRVRPVGGVAARRTGTGRQ
jgi:hypothetical protein